MYSNSNSFTYYPPVNDQVLKDKPSKFTPQWERYFTLLTNLIKELNSRVAAQQVQLDDHEARIVALETP